MPLFSHRYAGSRASAADLIVRFVDRFAPIGHRNGVLCPFVGPPRRDARYRQKMNAIEGIDLAPDVIQKQPSTNLDTLANPKRFASSSPAADWALSRG
jgi:hypothetical protein